MKAYLVLAASAIAMAATPAFADTTAGGNSSTITLGANVAAACGVGNHRSGATSGAGNTTDATYTLADSTGQFKTAQTQNRSFGNVWCNGPATVTITASQLSTSATTTDTSSFTNKFDVEVTGGAMVYAGGGTLATAGNASASQHADLPGAFETGLGTFSSVDIKVLPALGSGGMPLRPVAGAYAGTVTFTAAVS